MVTTSDPIDADEPKDFIRQRIESDRAEGKIPDGVVTRFPPEPNGYLHIGHAKSICLNFGVAAEYGGTTYLRFDDTNPLKESNEYVNAIAHDVEWLGYEWAELTYASDYFEELYRFAEDLVKAGKAYVCSLSAEEISRGRGTLTEPGVNSPYRDRSIEENLDLLARMRAGEFADGAHVLRAKIDMSSPNINMRDPVLYRIRHVSHHRTGDAWCIYPMYDFTHCICDALEGITHSLCTLEFEDHRPLYDWVLDNSNVNYHPPQIEFCVRQALEETAPRGMCVTQPLKVTLTNWQEATIEVEGPWHQKHKTLGQRALPFGRELFIERADFSLAPPKKWKRLSPGAMVRLRYGYIIRCDEVVSDADGQPVELKCTYFPDSKSGQDTSGLKPNGVIHWVSAERGVAVEVRSYERLFKVPDPSSETFLDDINQDSLVKYQGVVEPAIAASSVERFQFERLGYFCKDSELDGVYNKTVSLREGF